MIRDGQDNLKWTLHNTGLIRQHMLKCVERLESQYNLIIRSMLGPAAANNKNVYDNNKTVRCFPFLISRFTCSLRTSFSSFKRSKTSPIFL